MLRIFAILSFLSILTIGICGWVVQFLLLYWAACGLGVLWFSSVWLYLWLH